jgi:hypothetical protein
MKYKTSFFLFLLLAFFSCKQEISTTNLPSVESTTKPWTRWWWLGNAVDESSIDATLEAFAQAGLGGVEIANIYGAKGAEDKFIDHLSPEWIEKVNHTLNTAKRLGLEVDLTLGTGWPFGGPQVELEYAATKMQVKTIDVKQGEAINHKVELINEKVNAPLACVAAVAFDTSGKFQDLTKAIKNNNLSRAAQNKAYKLYLVYADKTAQKVKRASPGGTGWTLDHFSTEALNDYLQPYTKALSNLDHSIRSIFNDSYEVYGTDFSPKFFDAFIEKRGYDLKPYLEDLLSTSSDSIGNRIKADYRLTLSDMLLDDFNAPWNEWAHSNGLKTRLQAHGSPGNLIDLYASADIPECETFGSMPYSIEGFRRLEENIRKGDADPAMLRFSSSAAHISGKSLVSAESFTWLRDHFKTALSQCKPEVEDLFLNGVNHVFLHGSTYSPKEVDWPGWKFYASVNFHPSNPIWEDVAALFDYITNVQSFLQAGKPDNDVLIYWPFHDITNSFLEGKRMQQLAIHDLDTWLKNTPFYNAIQWLIRGGYGFDYLSDQFLEKISVENGNLNLSGGQYKVLIIPKSKHLPLASLEKLIALKDSGANIIFEDFPQTVPGFKNYRLQTDKMQSLLTSNELLKTGVESWDSALIQSGAKPEKWVDSGLKFIRRKRDNETIYFVVNHTSKAIYQWIPLGVQTEKVLIFDPLSSKQGLAQSKIIEGIRHTRVELKSGSSLVLRAVSKSEANPWDYYKTQSSSIDLNGSWNLSFLKGGPQLPKSIRLDSLVSWTELGTVYENFSGTAVYEHQFTLGETSADAWLLQIKDLRESAKIWLNGNYIGSIWANPFEIQLPNMKQGQHSLKIQVSNLGANRIRAKELRGEEWKNFYEINMVNKDYQAFDATLWEPTPSGIINTPKIIPLKISN